MMCSVCSSLVCMSKCVIYYITPLIQELAEEPVLPTRITVGYYLRSTAAVNYFIYLLSITSIRYTLIITQAHK